MNINFCTFYFIFIDYRICIDYLYCWTAKRWSCPQDGCLDVSARGPYSLFSTLYLTDKIQLAFFKGNHTAALPSKILSQHSQHTIYSIYWVNTLYTVYRFAHQLYSARRIFILTTLSLLGSLFILCFSLTKGIHASG